MSINVETALSPLLQPLDAYSHGAKYPPYHLNKCQNNCFVNTGWQTLADVYNVPSIEHVQGTQGHKRDEVPASWTSNLNDGKLQG